MQTRHIILLFFVFIITSTVVFFSYQKKETPPAFPSVENKPLVPFAPTGYFLQNKETRFLFTSTPSFPKTLPVYSSETIDRGALITTIPVILKSLGVSATPSSIIRGSIYTTKWSLPNIFSLILTSSKDGQTITYQRFQSTSEPLSSPAVGAQRFVDLFSTVFGYSNINTEETGGDLDGLLVLDSPRPKRFFSFSSSFIYGNYPFSSNSTSIFSASVITDDSGIVRSATLFIPKTPKASMGSVAIITPEQLLFNLESQRGSIAAIGEMNLKSNNTPSRFKTFSINSTSLFYAIKSGVYSPAFFVSGVGTTSEGTKQEASYFLWASP